MGVSLIILLSGWGYTGHSKISNQLPEAMGNTIDGFDKWVPYIVDHSSDPDYRKSWDNAESPRHFIDVDTYPEFLASGKLNHNYDSLVAKYGADRVVEEGILPWATQTTFDSLQFYFEKNDWDNARRMASDLSHYVGDGHMPLHVTFNYNGQETGNKGIHSRYESRMISRYADSISGEVKPVEYITAVDSFVFGYLYQSNRLCDSILKADNIAQKAAGNSDSDIYLASMWQNTSEMTQMLFSESTYALGSLIYTAWVRAGSPSLEATSSSSEIVSTGIEIAETFPNPVDSILTVNLQLHDSCAYKIELRNVDGGFVGKIEAKPKNDGSNSFNIDMSSLAPGVYMVLVHNAHTSATKRVVKR